MVVDRAGREHTYPPIAEEQNTDAISSRFLPEDERILIVCRVAPTR
ncbi:hypothetical protein [Streptosporangium sp. NPDC000396]